MITYVIIKMTTGEQVMACLEEDAPDYIEVSYPMVVNMHQIADAGKIHEHVTAKPFCQFSADKVYRLPKSSVMFYKELHEMLIPHYTRIVNAYEDTVLVKTKPQKELDWDEPEHMTVDEIRKRIDMLEEIFGKEPEKEEEEPFRVFIEGNDTIH